MMVIWKYPLEITDVQYLSMPMGAEILSAANQNGTICLWVKCNATNPPKNVTIRVVGTGQELRELARLGFIGSVLQGNFVWHIFTDDR